MTTHIKTIAVIPARGGSERFPRKNLARWGSTTLVGNMVRIAYLAGFDCVIVATDDLGIGREATLSGADVFIRAPVDPLQPSETPLIEVLDVREEFDVCALLQCTSPNILPDTLHGALEHCIKRDTPVFSARPDKRYFGAFAIANANDVCEHVSRFGHPNGVEGAFPWVCNDFEISDIDTREDYEAACRLASLTPAVSEADLGASGVTDAPEAA